MPSGLNSPSEVRLFSKSPEQYNAHGSGYFYEISQAQEHNLEQAKDTVRQRSKLKMIQFGQPTVDVQGNEYIYIIRSSADRSEFEAVMSLEHLYGKGGTKGSEKGIRGLHYSAHDRSGDAIGITIKAGTPEEAKEQFQAWYARVKEVLKALSERFVIVNKELDQQIEEAAAKRLDE